MTAPTLAPPKAAGKGNGGAPARRAIVRWAWRLVRRDWRQQVLILTLLTVAIAAAAAGVSAVYNIPRAANAELGGADHAVLLRDDGNDPGLMTRNLATVRAAFATNEVIMRSELQIPGSVEQLELRGQDPAGPLGRPLLKLRSGRYPTAPGEAAVTDGVATTFRTRSGGDIVLQRLTLRVVGIVENPLDLTDEFALVPPAFAGANSARVLVRAPDHVFDAFGRQQSTNIGFQRVNENNKDAQAIGVLVLSTLVLLLVALVSAASFTVIAQRRMRQIGVLAAMGATEKHLRLVMVATGLVLGLVASAAGTGVGLAVWLASSPRLEASAGHRINPLNLPWTLLATLVLLGIATATASAWMPARAAARIPITSALMSRPPQPRKTHRSVLLAGIFVVLGLGSLVKGDQQQALWMVVGIVAIGLGVLFVSPLAIRSLKFVAGRTPVASRLALRDLARYEARSGTALAAISLSLGIAVSIIIVAASAGLTAATGNLSDRQLFVSSPTECPCNVVRHTAEEVAKLQTAVDSMRPGLDPAAVVPLDVAVDPNGRETSHGRPVMPVVAVGRQISPTTIRDAGRLYVATPELLAYLHVDRSKVDPGADVLTSLRGVFQYAGAKPSVLNEGAGPQQAQAERPPAMKAAHIDTSEYTTAPRSVILPAAVTRLGWQPARLGWLIESRHPLTPEQVAAARAIAADAGLTVEARSGSEGLAATKTAATAAGMGLALAVLAMTVGLIRSEGAGDLRTLSATGASTGIRRGVTASTAGAMAALGVVLGTVFAYAAMIAAYRSDLSRLNRIPLLHLTVIVIGVPVLAYAAGWLFAAREPDSLGRHALD